MIILNIDDYIDGCMSSLPTVGFDELDRVLHYYKAKALYTPAALSLNSPASTPHTCTACITHAHAVESE